MAKKKKSSSNSNLTRLLYIGLIIIVAIIAVATGADPMQTLEEWGLVEPSEDRVTVETPPISGEWYNIYFTRSINSRNEADHHGATVEQALIGLIEGAQRTIDAALFELNSPDVTAALVRAVERGVRVRIVFDDEHALEDPESTAEEVIDAGAQYVSDERSALMHNKFFIIDSVYVWTGSMNITRNGAYNNNNNALAIRSQKLVENYQAEFDEMFEDGIFSTRGDNVPTPNRRFTLGGTLIETYFSSEDGRLIEQRLVELVNSAQVSIRTMTFSFTLEELGTAMINRLRAGVIVEGVFENTGSLQGQMPPLACAGANVRQDGNPNILHHKVIIIDEQIVATGSFNFSNNAIENNNENLLIIHNADIAAAYTREWQARFAEGSIPTPSELDC